MAAVFHAGEIAVQKLAGTYQGAGRIGRGIRAEIPASFREFMQDQVLAIAASVDVTGRVWASPLAGEPGFLEALDNHTLLIDAQPTIGDPVKLSSLKRSSSISGLASRLLRGRTLSAPAGQPASATIFASLRAVIGVCEAGLSTTGQPAAIAGASLCDTRLSGKLNGLMAAIGPIGKRRSRPCRFSPPGAASRRKASS